MEILQSLSQESAIAVVRPQLAHVFFVHSPITYSVALATIGALRLHQPVVVGARGIRGPAVSHYVDSDGHWSFSEVCDALECVFTAVPDGAPIAIYVPHTMYLLGQLLRLSRRIERICYLEEGLTSADASLQKGFQRPVPTDVDALRGVLQERRLLDVVGIDPVALAGLNRMAIRPFDADHACYGGCFACSPDAFPGMANVTRLTLTKDAELRRVNLLSIYGMHNRIDDKAVIEQAYRDILPIFTNLAAQQPIGQRLLVKLHPRDDVLQPLWLRLALQLFNASYADYCQIHQLDPNREPALLNFNHYYFVGPTAQAKYVEHCWGAERMTRIL